MDRATGRQNSRSLRMSILAVCGAIALVAALSGYKKLLFTQFADDSTAALKLHHAPILSLFQGSYYFYFEQQFIPGIRDELRRTPHLTRIQMISTGGEILFDSNQPKPPTAQPSIRIDREDLRRALLTQTPSAFRSGFNFEILLPSGSFSVLYTFDGSSVRQKLIWAAAGITAVFVGLLMAVGWIMRRARSWRWVARSGARLRVSGLRTKFLLTIVLINLITSGIVFMSLTALQSREETERVQKESLLFSQFSTPQVISSFSNYFYFYYAEKFYPAIKSILSTNENLVGLRIISKRSGTVVFDSESAQPTTPPSPNERVYPDWPSETTTELLGRETSTRSVVVHGVPMLSVIHTYRNESHEPLFYVEYRFIFASLDRSLKTIRREIGFDLIPSLAIGLLIASVFAQLLISPLRRLALALKKVSAGDYEVSVANEQNDEVGDLVTAFNSMTSELRKKTELRKYLSDSTYRQVMEAEHTQDAQMGGSRVEATVLFTDIRDFVSHCESMEAEEVTAMLNDYFSEMVEVVHKNGGEVDKFIGDAMLAVFYVDQTIGPAGTCLQAIYCALEMRERLKEFNLKRQAALKSTIEIGVGINHGELISGPIGAKDRMDFTVIGDVVNTASRIEKLSKLGHATKIVFSQSVEERVRGLLEYEKMMVDSIKGKEEPVEVFELIQVRDLKLLMEQARSSDFELRLRSIELLGQSRNREALPFLAQLISDSRDEIRLQATTALARLALPKDEPVLQALMNRLDQEQSPKVISALIAAFGRCCFDGRILRLARFLVSGDERIVANAVEAMGALGLPECIDLILPQLASRNNRVKANAAIALFSAGRIGVIDILKPMLMFSDGLMRSSAAFAIGELSLVARKEKLVESWKKGDHDVKVFLAELQECVPMLVALLKDPEPMVKRQAVIALGKIKDRSSVLPILDHIDLDRDTRDMLRDVATALQAIGSHRLVREVISQLG